MLVDLDPTKLETAAASVLQSGAPEVWPSACDVSREREVHATAEETLRRFGRLDIVVNNAGVMVFRPIEEQTEEDWRRVLGVDLLGAFFFIREAFRHMRQGGAIVNVASIHAVETTPLVASYAAAKSALLSLTRSAALEGTPKGIRVNAVLPGAIDTPMLRENPNIVSGRERVEPPFIGTPEDVAASIAYLASDDARFVQGAALRVDGGRLNRL